MKKFWTYVLLIFQIGMIVSLIKGIQVTLDSKSRVNNLEMQKTKLEEEKDRLEAQYKYVQSPEYLEKVARDELHLSKPGEEVVIVPEELLQQPEKVQIEPEKNLPIYMKWWEVFFAE